MNLTLSEDLVAQAKGMTNNLSAVVESLLATYVAQQNAERLAQARRADAAAAAWNAFNERCGSFADEHSPGRRHRRRPGRALHPHQGLTAPLTPAPCTPGKGR